MGLAGRAQGARRRRCGAIVDNEQRRARPAPPCAQRVLADLGPRRGPAAGASAALELLDDVTASTASLRLASDPAALGTRRILILGQREEQFAQISNGQRFFVDLAGFPFF
jgi:hypothetical protein